jgi:hypothetical protein
VRFEVVIASRQSEIFNTAVYRFLESRTSRLDDELVKVKSEPMGAHTVKQVDFWSETAAREFENFWRSFEKETPHREAKRASWAK